MPAKLGEACLGVRKQAIRERVACPQSASSEVWGDVMLEGLRGYWETIQGIMAKVLAAFWKPQRSRQHLG
jgi:hypothetical protein